MTARGRHHRHGPLASLLRLLAAGSATALLLGACGGGAGVTGNPNLGGGQAGVSTYRGPPPQTDDIQVFMGAVWSNLRRGTPADCGACHGANDQPPLFAREDDINRAYEAANAVVRLEDPPSSLLVTKVAGGHHCWLGSDGASLGACADIITQWIQNWANPDGAASAREVQLRPPVIKEVGQSRAFPDDPTLFQLLLHEPILTEFCASCHSSTAAKAEQPFFADASLTRAYDAAKARIDLDHPAQSRLVVRLREDFHNCWSDCADNSDEIQAAIEAIAAQIPVSGIDESLVVSKALKLADGTVASGGNRYEASQIALWEFKEGSGSTAFDTSGVNPAINLTLSGDIEWVGGWGIDVKAGKAQGSTLSSRKLRDLITATGEYSIEAWLAPANVTQEDTRIISYSAGTTARNFSLGQTRYSYEFLNRNAATDGNGEPRLATDDGAQLLQASLQHVVLSYDQVNGRRIHVNGEPSGDLDPAPGGNLNDWDDTFAFVLGNEVSGDRPWKGVLRLVAIHNRALSEAQIRQNMAAGVGEKYFLLFSVASEVGVPDAYIMFEAARFDTYSYLFQRPVFIVLGEDPPPLNIALQGMRIGINGVESKVGQAYINLDTTIAAQGQVLSSVGTILPLNLGPEGDEFFLSFERLGSHTDVRTEPAVVMPPPPPDGVPQPDIGVRIFDAINATMAQITGVSPQAPAVKQTYAQVKQQLPAVESIEGFLASHQVGVAQLAIEYCNALVDDSSLRSSFFPGFDFSLPAGTAFATPEARGLVIDPIVDRVLNTNLDTQPAAEMKAELESLIGRLTACGGSCGAGRTAVVVKASCAAAIGSAGMLIQ